MKKADNIFVKAKKYCKEHPKCSFQDAIQKVKGKKSVSGKKVGAVKRKTVRKSITGPRIARPVGKVAGTRKRTVAKRVATSNPGHLTSLQKARALVNDIQRLENKRKAEKLKELKDVIQLEINRKHDQLDKLKRSYK